MSTDVIAVVSPIMAVAGVVVGQVLARTSEAKKWKRQELLTTCAVFLDQVEAAWSGIANVNGWRMGLSEVDAEAEVAEHVERSRTRLKDRFGDRVPAEVLDRELADFDRESRRSAERRLLDHEGTLVGLRQSNQGKLSELNGAASKLDLLADDELSEAVIGLLSVITAAHAQDAVLPDGMSTDYVFRRNYFVRLARQKITYGTRDWPRWMTPQLTVRGQPNTEAAAPTVTSQWLTRAAGRRAAR